MNTNSPIDIHNKLFYHPERLGEFLKGGTTPVTWELDITNRCNHTCIGCDQPWAGGRANNEALNSWEAREYINQIKQLGGKAINLTGGGEPLFNLAFDSIVKYIKQVGLEVGLITNGSLLTRKTSQIILNNCSWVRISLDAGTSETFKKIRGRPEEEFNVVLNNIKVLVEEKKRLNSNCTVGVSFLTCKDTVREMKVFTDICKQTGVDYVEFRPFHGDSTNPYKLQECLKLETKEFKVLCSDFKYDRNYEKKYCRCHGQNFTGVINVHKVYICCHFRGKEQYEIGDLRKNTLREIWFSEKRKKVLEKIDLTKCLPLCKLDIINRFLDGVSEKPEHVNFI